MIFTTFFYLLGHFLFLAVLFIEEYYYLMSSLDANDQLLLNVAKEIMRANPWYYAFSTNERKNKPYSIVRPHHYYIVDDCL